MSTRPVFFIAFLEQDNLGVGYLSSVLLENSIDVKIIDFRDGKEFILHQALEHNPIIIGFSIIFQYHIDEFRDLINYLRSYNINCHFTAGGHYPSLRHAELLELISGLDSVVLFEGEYTTLELAQNVSINKNWKRLEGIAYRKNGSVITNKLRPLEENLDNFPYPIRKPLTEFAFTKKYATLLAGRGCHYNCSFCSIREFYSKPPGSVKRSRRPKAVVEEMEWLYKQEDCKIFMFQDDDFPVATKKEKEWTTQFCKLLNEIGLADKIMWKINCRPDEIDVNLFQLMKDSGLFLVYLGIEHGNDSGLQLMNKHTSAETNIQAINKLKNLGICYDYGFMLFHPESTFQSIEENLEFLEEICGDGSSPITFCKMLPYAKTKIEKILKEQNKLNGNPGFEDYNLLHPSLDNLYEYMITCFQDWIGRNDGLLNLSRWVRHYLLVYQKYFPSSTEITRLEKEVYECIARSNMFFTNTTKKLINIFNSQHYTQLNYKDLNSIKNDIYTNHSQFKHQLTNKMNQICSLAS